MKKIIYSFAVAVAVVLMSFSFVACDSVSNPKLESLTKAQLKAAIDINQTKTKQAVLNLFQVAPTKVDFIEGYFYMYDPAHDEFDYQYDPGDYINHKTSMKVANIVRISWANNTNEGMASKVVAIYVCHPSRPNVNNNEGVNFDARRYITIDPPVSDTTFDRMKEYYTNYIDSYKIFNIYTKGLN